MNRSKQFLSLLAASVCGGAVALFLAHVLLKEKNLPAPVPAPTSASEKTKQNPELSRPLPISGQDAGTLQAQFSETISRSMPARTWVKPSPSPTSYRLALNPAR